jgi:hypothetical protein
VSTVSRLHQRGPFVARQIAFSQARGALGWDYPTGERAPFNCRCRLYRMPALFVSSDLGDVLPTSGVRGGGGPFFGSERFHDAQFGREPIGNSTGNPLIFSYKGRAMEQLHLPLLARLDGPAVVPAEYVQRVQSYREAVQLCYSLRRVKLTKRDIAQAAGLYPPHVTDYLSSKPVKRELPGRYITAFESACGNTAISQWLALGSKLTVLEEMQAARRAA